MGRYSPIITFFVVLTLVACVNYGLVRHYAWKLIGSIDVADDGPLPEAEDYEAALQILLFPIFPLVTKNFTILSSVANSAIWGLVLATIIALAHYKVRRLKFYNQSLRRTPTASMPGR
jgi:hypothetical protein